MITKEQLAKIDEGLDAHFAELGDGTEGQLAFLKNDNAGVDVRFNTRENSLLNEGRLKRFGQKVLIDT